MDDDKGWKMIKFALFIHLAECKDKKCHLRKLINSVAEIMEKDK